MRFCLIGMLLLEDFTVVQVVASAVFRVVATVSVLVLAAIHVFVDPTPEKLW